jgi:hypothetical protein
MNKWPHKSTTHEERYFHVRDYNGFGNDATVFMRQTDAKWEASVAFCHPKDNFSRKVGRNVARRKFFAGKRYDVSGPTRDEAFNTIEMEIV